MSAVTRDYQRAETTHQAPRDHSATGSAPPAAPTPHAPVANATTPPPTAAHPSPGHPRTGHPSAGQGADRPRDADGMAVASFVLGLVGLLVFNLVFGPCAIVLATVALLRGTARKGRALLGLTLGVADLVVLFSLLAAHDTVTWTFGG